MPVRTTIPDALLAQSQPISPEQTRAIHDWAWLLMVLAILAVLLVVGLLIVTLRRRRRLLREAAQPTPRPPTPDPWAESAQRLDPDDLP